MPRKIKKGKNKKVAQQKPDPALQKILTTLHGYDMQGPYTPGGKDVWYCDYAQCAYTNHGVYRRYKIQNWRSSQFGKKFVLCDGCVRQYRKDDSSKNSGPSNVSVNITMQMPSMPMQQQMPQYNQQYQQQPQQYAVAQPQQYVNGQFVQQHNMAQPPQQQQQQQNMNHNGNQQQYNMAQPVQINNNGNNPQVIQSQYSMQNGNNNANGHHQQYSEQQEVYNQSGAKQPHFTGNNGGYKDNENIIGGDNTDQNINKTQSQPQPGGIQIIKQGWMMKEGGLIKSWKKRYFVLKSNKTLNYYDKEKAVMVKGTCMLDHVKSLKKKKSQGFEVVTSKRTWSFACKGEKERNSWFEKVKQIADV